MASLQFSKHSNQIKLQFHEWHNNQRTNYTQARTPFVSSFHQRNSDSELQPLANLIADGLKSQN